MSFQAGKCIHLPTELYVPIPRGPKLLHAGPFLTLLCVPFIWLLISIFYNSFYDKLVSVSKCFSQRRPPYILTQPKEESPIYSQLVRSTENNLHVTGA